jgi:glycolate oxidase FAD binding subunit
MPDFLQTIAPNATFLDLLKPSNVGELSQAIAKANAQNIGVIPFGNGSKLSWGRIIPDDRLLLPISTSGLTQLIEHAAADMTVTVEAGMKFSELQAILAQAGQFFPVDPHCYDQATIGGVIATADSGSLRHRYGGVRDLLLGVSFVRSDGELVKAGGRVVKNVAGYDLMKLLTGSYGTLGVMTQVTLRVYPMQPVNQTIVVTGEHRNLANLAQTLLNSELTPMRVDWLSAGAMVQVGLKPEMGLLVQFSTVAESVAVQVQRLREWTQQLSLSAMVYPAVDEAELWRQIGAIGNSLVGDAATGNRGTIVSKIGVKGSIAVDVLEKLAAIEPEIVAVIHAGSGLGRLVSRGDIAMTRSICEGAMGFLSILDAPLTVKASQDVWGYRGNAKNLMAAVKREFDPIGVLNPDRFVV